MPPTRLVTRCRSTPSGSFSGRQSTPSGSSARSHSANSHQHPQTDAPSSQDNLHGSPSPQPDSVANEDLPKTVPKKPPTFWDVDVIDDAGHISGTRLRVQDLFASSNNIKKVVTKWNSDWQPVGDSAGLLAGYLGEIVRKFDDFPIMYDSWKEVPTKYKDVTYRTKIQSKFVVDDGAHKKYILTSLGKKWRDTRHRLFAKYYNWELSLEENLKNCPHHIDEDHWTVYVNYRRKAKTMEIADKNAANREKLENIPRLGSKTLARKRDELELQDGRKYSRGDMYSISYKRKDGSFVSEDTKEKSSHELESPRSDARHSSESSHLPGGHGPSTQGAI